METGPIHISTLIYCIAKETENVFKTITFSKKKDENDFETVKTKFESHFEPNENSTHEKVMFHLSAQRPGEYVTTFARALFKLADGCNFDKYVKIKDRFIIGLQDKE